MSEIYEVDSNSVTGLKYKVVRSNGGWECECPAGQSGKECVHIRKVKHDLAHGSAQTLNSNLVVIVKSKSEVEGPLELGEDVVLLVQGTVVKIEQEDLMDGTYDRIAKVKATLVRRVDGELKSKHETRNN